MESKLHRHLRFNYIWYVGMCIVVLAVIGLVVFLEWNDQQYFKTLDKLTCEQIWDLMIRTGSDWDTTEYFGTRCNR